MGRTAKPRKAYRPKPVMLNSVQRAIENAGTLDKAGAAMAKAAVDKAFDDFKRGERPAFNFDVMADALNIAESLSALGIASDPESRQAIHQAQATLAALAAQHQAQGTWTMRAHQIQAIDDGLLRHKIQLDFASRLEYERALQMTRARLSAALRGQIDAVIIAPGGRTLDAPRRAG